MNVQLKLTDEEEKEYEQIKSNIVKWRGSAVDYYLMTARREFEERVICDREEKQKMLYYSVGKTVVELFDQLVYKKCSCNKK